MSYFYQNLPFKLPSTYISLKNISSLNFSNKQFILLKTVLCICVPYITVACRHWKEKKAKNHLMIKRKVIFTNEMIQYILTWWFLAVKVILSWKINHLDLFATHCFNFWHGYTFGIWMFSWDLVCLEFCCGLIDMCDHHEARVCGVRRRRAHTRYCKTSGRELT